MKTALIAICLLAALAAVPNSSATTCTVEVGGYTLDQTFQEAPRDASGAVAFGACIADDYADGADTTSAELTHAVQGAYDSWVATNLGCAQAIGDNVVLPFVRLAVDLAM